MDSMKKNDLKVGVHTFGCRSNYADTVEVQASLVERGATPCSIEDRADVYLINTCTVTDSADRDVLKLLRKLRREQPDSRVVVTGCMAEARGAELSKIDGVDLVIGPGRREELVSGVLGESLGEQRRSTEQNIQVVHPSGRRVKKSLPMWNSISMDKEMPSAMAGPGEFQGELPTRARFHLRVQEGCENSCTFCIIPSTRGRLSSRPLDLVLRDIENLASLGYEEVVLSGTHLGGWGEDIGLEFADLLEAIGRSAEISRVRISSIDPNDLTEKAINWLVKYPIFCNHLHICFQAFSDNTLKRMNRKYRLHEAVALVHEVSKALPNCAIGSDIIAGFPGETREEIEEGMELFLRLPISYLHVFPYSERSETAAIRLDGEVPPAERKRRSARWRALAQRKKEEYLRSLVGKELEIIAERVATSEVRGTSREFASCKVQFSNSSMGSNSGEEISIPSPGELFRANAIDFDPINGEVVCE